VNFIEELQPQLRRNMNLYGFGELVGPIVAVGRDFNDIVGAYASPAPLIAAFETAARSAISLGAQVIIPGEGPLNVLLASNGVNRVDDVPVLDSLGVGIALCEVRARQYRGQGCGRHAVASSSPPHRPRRSTTPVGAIWPTRRQRSSASRGPEPHPSRSAPDKEYQDQSETDRSHDERDIRLHRQGGTRDRGRVGHRRASAEAFAAAGAMVAVADISEVNGKAAVDAIEATGGQPSSSLSTCRRMRT